MLALVVSCDDAPGVDPGPRTLELANDTIRLEQGVTLVEVEVRRAADGDFDPAAIEAHTGDVVRFAATDNGGHAIVFESTALATDARDWLERTGQMRSPPLITSGSAWVVTLDGAPPGDYPFLCSTHSARGRLTVSAR
ncbi:MAG TPA: plastocyanin/azurin family copper-binding protein [Longimicrobiales bacterium]|nr:plastocyanin/azurin family copper-binding protein [Longimicrobiales bacterium]